MQTLYQGTVGSSGGLSGKNECLYDSVLQKSLTSWTELALLVFRCASRYETLWEGKMTRLLTS